VLRQGLKFHSHSAFEEGAVLTLCGWDLLEDTKGAAWRQRDDLGPGPGTKALLKEHSRGPGKQTSP